MHAPGQGLFQDKDPGFRALDPEGWNGGQPGQLLDVPVTPVSRFFVRNHAAVPAVDPATWRLEVHGLVGKPLRLSLADLWRHFPRREVYSTLICAGFRRTELMRHREVPGELAWGLEPVGTASWRGVALRDVLQAAGVREAATDIGLTGLDEVERKGARFGFGGSIPVGKAMTSDVLLADEMNGEPLPALHGGPVRVIVPGYIGARSVKWLGQIEALAQPSENYFQREAYRIQRQADPTDPRSVRAGTALGETVLNAVILSPAEDEAVRAGRVPVTGWAIGAGGRELVGVEVSPDGGVSWAPAELGPVAGAWTWRRWNVALNLAPGRGVLVARASDGSGMSQPGRLEDAWNVKGYVNNAWHRVLVWVAP